MLLLAVLAPPAVASSEEVSSLEAREYAKVFGVSPERTVDILEIQAKGVDADIVSALEDRLGSGYAGVWFDNETGEFVVPLVTGRDRADIAPELRSHALGNHFRTVPVKASWQDLQSAQSQLMHVLDPLIDQRLVLTSLDPRANSVVVQVAASATLADKRFVERQSTDVGAEVDLETAEVDTFTPRALTCNAAGHSCGRAMRGGVGIKEADAPWDYECTAAFKAIGDVNAARYMLTAGHCVRHPTVNYVSSRDHQLNERYLGYVEQATYPGGDWAKINASYTWWDEGSTWPVQVAYWGLYNEPTIDAEYPITAEASSFAGQLVCHSGATTGGSCGIVSAIDVEPFTYEEGPGPMYHLTEVQHTCLDEGDSGGPVFAANAAIGIFSGGYGSGCDTSGFYMEVTEATDALGAHVAPRPGSLSPTVETKAATDVSEFKATLNGAINPNGLATTYRFEYGTNSSYGESVPVNGGSAGAGSSSVPVSAPVDRLEPGTTYHYRIAAGSAGGTAYGSDQTFHTPGLRFMRGLSSGSSLSSWSTAIGMDLPLMAVGDVDGDGRADVVSVEKDNGLYRYKFGYSDGSGIPKWDQVLTGMGRPTRLAVGDLTGDGKADVVAVEPEGNGKYRYMLGYGTGAGISNWNQVMSGMSYPHKLALGDLTGDGKADLVAVESQPNGQYRYMLGTSNGAGIGSWSQILSNMAYAEFMDLGDFNADGKADVVAVENQGNGQFRFMLGTSNGVGIGSWSQVMANMAGPYFFHLGDLDGDGKADIVSAETM